MDARSGNWRINCTESGRAAAGRPDNRGSFTGTERSMKSAIPNSEADGPRLDATCFAIYEMAEKSLAALRAGPAADILEINCFAILFAGAKNLKVEKPQWSTAPAIGPQTILPAADNSLIKQSENRRVPETQGEIVALAPRSPSQSAVPKRTSLIHLHRKRKGEMARSTRS